MIPIKDEINLLIIQFFSWLQVNSILTEYLWVTCAEQIKVWIIRCN